MLIEVAFVFRAERISVVLAYSAPSVVLVVEALPGVLAGAKKYFFAAEGVLDCIKILRQLVEVVADLAHGLTTVYKDEELWFHAAIKVQLDFGLGITVHADVVEVRILKADAFVVGINFVANRVPLGSEEQARVNRSLLVHPLHEVF